jgi:hypothetical protein
MLLVSTPLAELLRLPEDALVARYPWLPSRMLVRPCAIWLCGCGRTAEDTVAGGGAHSTTGRLSYSTHSLPAPAAPPCCKTRGCNLWSCTIHGSCAAARASSWPREGVDARGQVVRQRCVQGRERAVAVRKVLLEPLGAVLEVVKVDGRL